MEKPKVDLTMIIHYLREKCGKETYAKQIEVVQKYLAVPNTTADKIDVEEVLCRSVLMNARRLFEKDYPHSESLMFMELMLKVQTELREWKTLGVHYYGEAASTPQELHKLIDRRLEQLERRRDAEET